MAEESAASAGEEHSDLKRQLVQRAAIAAVLAAALLGGLAIFDRLDQEAAPEPPIPRRAATPEARVAVPAAPAPATAPLPPEPATDQIVAPPDSQEPPTAAPDAAAVPAPPATAPATIAPRAPAQTLRVLAAREPVAAQSEPGAAGRQPAVAAAVPESSATPEVPPPPVVAAVPTAGVPEETGGPLRRPIRREAAATRVADGYIVQAGVFNSPRRAEELHDRLRRAGIPVRLETRVQVGPFASRAEAETAREKLKSLGVESLLVAPRVSGNP